MVMVVQQAHSINANQKKLSTIFLLKIFGIVINQALDELQNLRDKKVNIHYKWKKKKKTLSFLESFWFKKNLGKKIIYEVSLMGLVSKLQALKVYIGWTKESKKT